jgi:hypothetical protein
MLIVDLDRHRKKLYQTGSFLESKLYRLDPQLNKDPIITK